MEKNSVITLEFNESGFDNEITQWRDITYMHDKNIVPAYQALELGEYTDAVFRSLINNQFESITDQSLEVVKQGLSTLPKMVADEMFKTLRDAVYLRINVLRKEVASFLKLVNDRQSHFRAPFIDLRDTVYENGRLSLKDEQIRLRYTVLAQTPDEHTLYNILKPLEGKWNETIDLLKAAGFDSKEYPMISGWRGYFKDLDASGQLYINTSTFKNLSKFRTK